MSKPLDSGKSFLEGLKGKLTPEKQALLDGVLADPDLVAAIGDGTLARADYTRQTQALAADRKALDDYYAKNNPLVERAQKLLEMFPDGEVPADFGTKDPNAPAAPVIDPTKLKGEISADLQKAIDDRDRGAVLFFGAAVDLAQKHQALFGEPLNTTEFLQNPLVMQKGLDAAHREIFAEKYAAREQAAVQAQIDAALKTQAEAHAAELAKARVAQPGLVGTSARNPVMETLHTEVAKRLEDPKAFEGRSFVNRVDAAAAAEEYQRLAAAGTGAAG